MTSRSKIEPEYNVCGSCGTAFGCGAKTGDCWCFSLEVDRRSLQKVSEKYADCLCQRCLVSFSHSPAILITYPDESTELIVGAVRVDTQNFHEGMYDFYDDAGNLVTQKSMSSGISWENLSETKTSDG